MPSKTTILLLMLLHKREKPATLSFKNVYLPKAGAAEIAASLDVPFKTLLSHHSPFSSIPYLYGRYTPYSDDGFIKLRTQTKRGRPHSMNHTVLRTHFSLASKPRNDMDVIMPTVGEIDTFKDAFAHKYHSLSDVYAIFDGLKLHLKQSGDCVIQNMFYNGWTLIHYVSNVFVFAPNGTIIACAINAPGSMHDSQ
eukprot:IDg5037t1